VVLFILSTRDTTEGKKGKAYAFPEPSKAEIRKHDVAEPEDKEVLTEI